MRSRQMVLFAPVLRHCGSLQHLELSSMSAHGADPSVTRTGNKIGDVGLAALIQNAVDASMSIVSLSLQCIGLMQHQLFVTVLQHVDSRQRAQRTCALLWSG